MVRQRSRRSALPLVLLGGLLVAIGGASGCEGSAGQNGNDGAPGTKGDPGTDGTDGTDGSVGPKGDPGDPAPPKTAAANLAEYVKERTLLYATGTLPEGEQFPLVSAATDSLRTLAGVHSNVVVSWLDPLTFDDSPGALRFGANTDYIAYFGDGWDKVAGDPPQWHGDGTAGWVWVNHEYISGSMPSLTSAPTGAHLHFARFLRQKGLLTNDVEASVWSQADLDTYIRHYKEQLGGSWLRILQDPSTGEWAVDRSADGERYDASSNTLLRVTGHSLYGPDHDDATGAALPAGVVSGIMGDCAGGTTPWGTVITAEENVQDYYGDLETCWSSDQKFLTGQGFDPGSNINPNVTPSPTSDFGRIGDPNGRHTRDLYGYLSEMDPGQAPDEFDGATAPGVGHKKIGAMGRARWEAAAFAVDSGWKLMPNQPVVVYGTDDRRSGRIYKFVSAANYTAGMTRAQTRALLDNGTLYVAHFAGLDVTTGDTMAATGQPPTEAMPGAGMWVELDVNSTQIAPNAAALGDATKTIGAALKDVSWNGIGGFPTNDDVRRATFTAAAKLGVTELNRPEDIEWNPRDFSGKPRIYVTFTNDNKRTQTDQDGVLRDPATHAMSTSRADITGSIFSIEETDPAAPGTSMTFAFFQVWHGSVGEGDFDAANPDNLLIDQEGGVWFGTDGNFVVNGRSDAIYYLDLDPTHKAGEPGIMTPTFGKPFRVVAMPSDAEATGPNMSSDMGTLFVSVQHPGEYVYSKWPGTEPISSLVAVTFAIE